ncbi:unnamed protein product [Tetraodon nigroviridis]|uniref:(spotted green pufferfish) hypothetical protein n=1 Tax=Tetraodon nigroviridis TaxID=99883 RepID=Q4TI23_TETNG|nr:unnamed protein product [Tetraodon nigroviridis]
MECLVADGVEVSATVRREARPGCACAPAPSRCAAATASPTGTSAS